MPPQIPNRKDHTVGHFNPQGQLIWDYVSASPLRSLWDLQGAPALVIFKRTVKAFNQDNLLSRAAELGFYFLFALFPTLVSATSILGLVAHRATQIYVELLEYLSIVIPHSAFVIILQTFNQTQDTTTSGKITFGLAAAIWSASVGFSAIQDTLNTVYKVRETRPFWKARASAILVTLLLAVLTTLILAVLLGGDFIARRARVDLHHRFLQDAAGIFLHTIAAIVSFALIILFFAVIYYFAPDVKTSSWRWLTPGAAVGILGWIAASFALRAYLHYFDFFSLTYGSLGAVIILLMWFYITGLMLLLGAEINSEIEATATEQRLHDANLIPAQATVDAQNPLPI